MSARAPLRVVAALAALAAFAHRPAPAVPAPAADSARAAPHPALPPGHPGSAGPHAGPAPGAPSKPFKVVIPAGTPRVKAVTLGVRHRVFHDFAEVDEAPLRKPFAIGDTPYSATITDFLPDFVIDVATRSITSRSNEPRNPAVRIIVREDGLPRDTTWAFLNMPPHFAARSLLAFKILRIDFTDRPPLAADSTVLGARPARPDSSARKR